MEKQQYLTREEIQSLLTDTKQEGDWLMTWCPAHRDGEKSGKRSLGLSAKGTLECFAGCTDTTSGFLNVIKLLKERVGETPPPREVQTPHAPRGTLTLVDVYDYRTPDGKLVAQKGRFEKPDGTKTFKWRTEFNKPDHWNGGVDVKTMPLWGAELLAKEPMDQWVFFCEGEKATKACRANGLTAVCHGGGASTRDFGDSLLVLQGRKVALWPDNDEPGRKYVMAVQRELISQCITNSIHVVSVPVPVKGDAYDYFAKGGKAEDLFKNYFAEPLVEVVTRDFIRVTCPTELGPVVFSFDGLVYETRSLACEFCVTPTVAVTTQESYCTRAENLLSTSWRESTVRALNRMFGEANWTLALNTAVSRARQAMLEAQRAVNLGEGSCDVDEMPPEMEFLAQHFLPANQITTLFADGDSGKTWLAYAIGLSVATGEQFLGLEVRKGNVLIVDWETDERQARRRIKRLLKAQNIQTIPSSLHYRSGDGIPFSEHAESLKRLIREKGIDLLIIDSGGPACGGDPSDPRATISFFNALARMNTTVLVICHVTKDNSGRIPDKPFGSVYWHNLSRRTFFLGYDKPSPHLLNLAAVNRKANDGPRVPPLSFRVSFAQPDGVGPVLVEPINFRTVEAFKVFLPTTERIWLLLRDEGQPLAFHEIMKHLNWQGDDYANRLSSVLKWGKNNGWFETVNGGPGQVIKWKQIGEGPRQA